MGVNAFQPAAAPDAHKRVVGRPSSTAHCARASGTGFESPSASVRAFLKGQDLTTTAFPRFISSSPAPSVPNQRCAKRVRFAASFWLSVDR